MTNEYTFDTGLRLSRLVNQLEGLLILWRKEANSRTDDAAYGAQIGCIEELDEVLKEYKSNDRG